MNINNAKQTIRDELEIEDDKLVHKLLQATKILHLDATAICEHWDAYSFQSGGRESLIVNEENIITFLTQLKSKMSKQKKVSSTPHRFLQSNNSIASSAKKREPSYYTQDQSVVVRKFTSPTAKSLKSSVDISQQKFQERTNSGESICTLNETITVEQERPKFLPQSDIQIKISPIKTWLWAKPHEVSSVQRQKIEDFGKHFRTLHEHQDSSAVASDDEFFERANKPSQSDSFYVGRIVSKNSMFKRMDKNSVYFEGFHEHRSLLVQLDVSKLNNFSVFPGQIVVVKGINPDGQTIFVTELFNNFSSPKLKSLTDPVIAEKIEKKRGGLDLVVFVASGPFCCDNTFGFENSITFHKFLNTCSKDNPDVIILTGPIIDAKNKKLQCCERTYSEEFSTFVNDLYKKMPADLLKTNIIFIPSTRDIHHRPNFPQPPYKFQNKEGCPEMKLPENWFFLSNPSEFTIDGVSFAVTTNDTLLTLNKSEYCRFTTKDHRLCRLVSHCILQQSFSPVYPQVNVPIDWSNQESFKLSTPDIFIMPSLVKTLAQTLENGTVFVNPGFLVRGQSSGSYCRINIKFPRDGDRLSDNVRVDVLRV